MVIRATEREIELSGSPSELRRIALQLAKLGDGDSWEFVGDATANPAPYEQTLIGFRVVTRGGLVRVFVVGSWLVAEGDAESLARMGAYFTFPDAAEFPAHGHFEWYQGHSFIAEESWPLVISVSKAG